MAIITSETGVSTIIAEEDGKLITGTSQDCTPILEQAKRLHNEGLHGSAEMKHAARIPMVIVEKFCNLRGITFAQFMQDQSFVREMLSDPALADFRIWKGRV